MDQEQIPRRPAPNDNVGGTAYDIKFFPSSRQGRQAPFAVPPVVPPRLPNPLPSDPDAQAELIQKYFDGWVAFFVDLVGAKLEKLNGLQFNLDLDRPGNAQLISDELGALADALKVGSARGPRELRWPLAGSYIFTWAGPDLNDTDFRALTIDLYFEDDPDFRMVVNCTVVVDGNLNAPIAPNSSSSSYIATSSSG